MVAHIQFLCQHAHACEMHLQGDALRLSAVNSKGFPRMSVQCCLCFCNCKCFCKVAFVGFGVVAPLYAPHKDIAVYMTVMSVGWSVGCFP